MLELTGAAALELRLVPVLGEPQRVKEAHRGLDAEFLLEGASREPHLGARRAHRAILEQHGHDSHHGKPAICYLGIELLLADLRVSNGRGVDDPVGPEGVIVGPVLDFRQAEDEARRKLPRRQFGVLVGGEEFHGQAEEDNLGPANRRHLSQSRQAVGNVSKLEADRRGKVARPFEVLGDNVPNAGEHAHTPVFELHTPPTVELLLIAVRGEARRVPEARRGLDAQLVLERPDPGPAVAGAAQAAALHAGQRSRTECRQPKPGHARRAARLAGWQLLRQRAELRAGTGYGRRVLVKRGRCQERGRISGYQESRHRHPWKHLTEGGKPSPPATGLPTACATA
mmetsp:Transcript_23146/g.64218  ORF Transcript_23146/g.64218 Transcript_23146/m.64218 type:complete len:341 (+) Transcript_23146:975-1997(+)